jgi:hypothetical protein
MYVFVPRCNVGIAGIPSGLLVALMESSCRETLLANAVVKSFPFLLAFGLFLINDVEREETNCCWWPLPKMLVLYFY